MSSNTTLKYSYIQKYDTVVKFEMRANFNILSKLYCTTSDILLLIWSQKKNAPKKTYIYEWINRLGDDRVNIKGIHRNGRGDNFNIWRKD